VVEQQYAQLSIKITHADLSVDMTFNKPVYVESLCKSFCEQVNTNPDVF
jgi:hypothetical protein